MTDKDTFRETVRAVAEIVRTSQAPLSEAELLSYFSDMDLSGEQKSLVLQYLTTPCEEAGEDAAESNDSVNMGGNAGFSKPKGEEWEGIEGEDGQETGRMPVLQLYFDELARLPVYTEKKRQQMYDCLLSGSEEVISRIVEMWLSNVTEIAKQYERERLPVEDLIQEGNMALFLKLTELCGTQRQEGLERELENAIELGIMQYASEVTREQELENAMRGKLRLVYEAARFLKAETGREPSVSELADYTKLPQKELQDIMDRMDKVLGEEEWNSKKRY